MVNISTLALFQIRLQRNTVNALEIMSVEGPKKSLSSHSWPNVALTVLLLDNIHQRMFLDIIAWPICICLAI